ncbi:MAG: hypothetical protein WCK16_04430 [Candidatus Moraniibacteriota bacterium]
MKKIILKLFVNIITLNILMLSLGRNVFGATAMEFPEMTTIEKSPGDFIYYFIGFVILLSCVLTIFFLYRFFILANRLNEASKVKTKKYLIKAIIFLVISMILVVGLKIFGAMISPACGGCME